MSYIDFEAIKAQVKIEDVIPKLGLDMKKNGKQYRSECPACNSGGDRSLVATPDKKAFYCFAAQKGGDVIAFVAHVRGCGQKEAAQFLAGDTVPPEKEKPREERGFKPLDYLEPDHDAVIAFGLDPDDAARIGAGYAKRGVMRGTVAIPVRDATGRLLGYLGCTEAVLPKTWHF